MTWTLDKQHVDLGFSAKHLMVATVRGRFSEVDAEIELDEEHPEASSVVATVRADSITTGNPDRDAHLKNADFFDVERYPELTFRSTAVRLTKASEFELTGDLTIRDVTRPVTLRGEFEGPVAAPWGDRRAGFSLSGEVDRGEFGLTMKSALDTGSLVVSRTIKLQIEAEVSQPAAIAAA